MCLATHLIYLLTVPTISNIGFGPGCQPKQGPGLFLASESGLFSNILGQIYYPDGHNLHYSQGNSSPQKHMVALEATL